MLGGQRFMLNMYTAASAVLKSAEAQEGAHGHGRRRPPVLGQSVGACGWDGRCLCLGLGSSGAKETPPAAGRRGPLLKA